MVSCNDYFDGKVYFLSVYSFILEGLEVVE